MSIGWLFAGIAQFGMQKPFALATKSIMSTYATKIKNKNRSRWQIIEKYRT